jgi:deoxyribodipyrimidine photolyase-related protein
MVKPRLILVLGDQLSPDIAALRAADRLRDVVVMAEAAAEAQAVPHHPQKIALVLTAMRKFARSLQADGWRVAYSLLEDPQNSQSIAGELLRYAARFGADEVIATRCGDHRLMALLDAVPLAVRQVPDDRFICSEARFAEWATERKQLRMEYFYRDMRRQTGLLMQGDKPIGGQWNFDHDNRKPAKPDLFRPQPLRFTPDAETEAVLAMVEVRFRHFGHLRPFHWATDRAQALQVLDHFITHALPRFGDEQDAMLRDDPTLSHAMISPYLNLGLLAPLEVCQRAEAAYHAGMAPLNAVEGFIRQIIGWREFMRGIWALEGPDYTSRNALAHDAALPPLYWGAPTRMACLSHAVAQTRDMAYAHHIQRLMVTGNFALLAGVDPAHVHGWYLAVYVDAFEWVEAPNTIGMSQFADGGVVGSKPYVSSGAYIDRMSDYCSGCHYKVKEKSGVQACPFNLLYWDFLMRHRTKFGGNPRMAQMYRVWDKMEADHKASVLADAAGFLTRLRAGETV